MTADSDPVPPCRHSDYGECTPCQRDRVVSELAKVAAHLFQRNGECRELMAQRDSHAAEIARLVGEKECELAAWGGLYDRLEEERVLYREKGQEDKSEVLAFALAVVRHYRPSAARKTLSQSLDSAGG